MKRKLIFVLFTLAVLLIGTGIAVTAPAAQTDKPIRGNDFKVEIDGLPMERVVSVEHIGVSVDAIDYRTGDDNVVCATPGAGKANSVVLTGILTEDLSIQDWVKATYDGEDVRKDISIEIFDRKGDTVRTFDLFDCFPTHYEILNLDQGANPDVLHWTLEVRVNRIEMA